MLQTDRNWTSRRLHADTVHPSEAGSQTRNIHTSSTSPPHFDRSVFLERSYLSGVDSNKAAEIGACQGSDVKNDSEGGVDAACSVVIVCSTYIRGVVLARQVPVPTTV